MKNLNKFFMILFLIIVLSSSLVLSVGVSRKQYKLPSYEFEPGLEFTIDYAALHPDYDTSIEKNGVFAEFGELSREFIPHEDSDKSFSFHVKIPDDAKAEDFPPGTNIISLTVKELPPEDHNSGGMFFITTSAVTKLKIFVPYPGYYAEFSQFKLPNVNLGEDSTLTFELWNRGKNGLLSTNYDFNLKNLINNKVLFSTSGQIPRINSQEKELLTIDIPSSTFTSGEYFAELTYNYNNKQIEKNTTFKVGTLNVDILNHTKQLYNDSIKKFDIEIQSDWNDVIPKVYAEVNLNGTIAKSTPEDLSNFQTKTISAYLDTTSFNEGNYSVNITLFYSDKTKQETGNLEILKFPEQKKSLFSSDNLMVLLIVLLILIFLGLILMTFIFNKKRNDKNGTSKKDKFKK